MRAEDLGRLLLLSALWGGSFLFMRIAAPVLGPIVVAESRVLIAGLALLLYACALKRPMGRLCLLFTVLAFSLLAGSARSEETKLGFKFPAQVVVSEKIPDVASYYGGLQCLYDGDSLSVFSWIAADVRNPDNGAVVVIARERRDGASVYHVISIAVREGDRLRRFEDKPYFSGKDATGYLTPAEENPNLDAVIKMKDARKAQI